MHRNTKRLVLIPVVASFILSTTAGFAGPVNQQADQNNTQQTQASDKAVTTFTVVRSKEDPSDIRLVDLSQKAPAPAPAPAPAAPVTSAPVDQPTRGTTPAPIAKPEVVAEAQVQTQPVPVQTQVQPTPRTVQKPAAKPAPKPAAKPQRVAKPAPKPKSPAPKSALRKAKPAPKRKVASAPKPDPRKQSIITRVVYGATSLVSRALSWIGTRYIWGGLSSSGVDCSGLTKLIYRAVGVILPHNAKAQFKMGRPVAKSSLAPGDLVFFNTTGPISHVGIYIGNNKFVHAANKKRGVRTDSLGSAYYYKRFAGARRYI